MRSEQTFDTLDMVGLACRCAICIEDRRFLRAAVRPRTPARRKRPIRIVDLFSGCGGLTCGMGEAARRVGQTLDIRLAVEFNKEIAAIYRDNFPAARLVTADVAQLFPGRLGRRPSRVEVALAESVGAVDVLLAGPPCQGHSDLNNHTRRNDPKNTLYLRVARAAEILQPEVVLIENVPAVRHDRTDVVGATRKALEESGYQVYADVVKLERLGVPQLRRRYLLIASRTAKIDPVVLISDTTIGATHHLPRTVRWAIEDLSEVDGVNPIDKASRISEDNARRIEYLFEHDAYDLPDEYRPPCHRDKDHSYRSMYGRLHWDRPAQTITTGFSSMGQGRYVHPAQPRTLTPHEAARIQGFPDWFSWSSTSRRTVLSTAIGNAVPPLACIALGTKIVSALGS
jgi:DNA (cytosine-5)-methyltransferase 1